MAIYSAEQIAGVAQAAGFKGESLVIAIAVAMAESSGDTNALGDTTITTAVWGPSVGLWQVRTLKAETGTGKSRDKNKLTDPAFNARSAYSIAGGGSNFKPWSMYTNGRYKKHMEAARKAAKQPAAGSSAGGSIPGGDDVGGGAGETEISLYQGETHVSSLPFTGGTLEPVPQPPRDPRRIAILGQPLSEILGEFTVSGEVDMALEETSEIVVRFTDPDLELCNSAWLKIDVPVTWPHETGDWDLEINRFEVVPDANGIPELVVYLWPRGVTELKRAPALTRNKVRTDQWIAQSLKGAASALTLRHAGVSTYVRDSLGPNNDEDADIWEGETVWEVIQRLKNEEATIAFTDLDGELWYGRPEHIMRARPNADVGWRNGHGKPWLDATELPTVHYSEDFKSRRVDTNEVTVKVPRWRGESFRPGMGVMVRGLGRFDLRRIVTRVHWALDGGVGDVEVSTAVIMNKSVVVLNAGSSGLDARKGSSSVTTGGGGGTPTKGTKSALDMVAWCQKQVGKKYIYGAEAKGTDPDPKAFDCSELIEWACYQVGVKFVDGSSNQKAACKPISVAEASKIRGALLFFPGHVVVSLGDGNGTVEARGKQYGVVNHKIAGRGFTSGGLIPGLNYG